MPWAAGDQFASAGRARPRFQLELFRRREQDRAVSLPALHLSALFLAARPAPAPAPAPAPGDDPALEALLAELWERARRAWPGIALEPAAFMRHLAERLPDGEAWREALAATHVEDLYLACACAAGDGAALAALERDFIARVSAYLARPDALPGFTEELKQHLRVHLLVPKDGLLPRIASYSGRGPLGGWLRMATVRAAINLQTAAQRTSAAEALPAELADAVAPDPDVAFLKLRHGAAFKAAFEAALETLTPREGTIIQLYFLRGMTAESIGRVYGVGLRAVQRWVLQIREKILARTRRELASRLAVSTRELEALMRLLQSQLSSTITRFFEDKP
jgi:RNA polymerase sigma-70 factor (ECF subfamily)